MNPTDGLSDTGAFGPIHIVQPSLGHTHTAIMLHGRGSNGPEFAQELAETAAPGQKPLTDRFPSWRWVFPSSQELWSTAFEEMLPAWFEAHSLTDTTAREDLQMEGIRQSVAYIQSILDREVADLGGKAEKAVIMGISQGGAVGMWTLLGQRSLDKRIGAFVGASTWLPFAANIQSYLVEQGNDSAIGGIALGTGTSNNFVKEMMPAFNVEGSFTIPPNGRLLLATPVFLSHGVDDAFVGIELGQQAKQVLANGGFQVEWNEYSGAELEGHWLKAPEQIDDIAAFLIKTTAASANLSS